MAIMLSPETEELLQQEARRTGQDVSALANSLLLEMLHDAPDPDALSDADIADIRAGIERGLQDAAEGRIKSQAQAIADIRARHGFAASWASGADGTK